MTIPHNLLQEDLRLDLWVYYMRLAKTRDIASKWIRNKNIIRQKQKLSKPHAKIKIGDIITFPFPHRSKNSPPLILTWKIKALPSQRLSASETSLFYEEIDHEIIIK